jgi:hypothetical protein
MALADQAVLQSFPRIALQNSKFNVQAHLNVWQVTQTARLTFIVRLPAITRPSQMEFFVRVVPKFALGDGSAARRQAVSHRLTIFHYKKLIYLGALLTHSPCGLVWMVGARALVV